MKKLFVVMIAFLMVIMAFTMVIGTASADRKGNTVKIDYVAFVGDGWGKLTYDAAGPEFRYSFVGHDLESGDEYILWILPSWESLGKATVNTEGNINIHGSINHATFMGLALLMPSSYPFIDSLVPEPFELVTYTAT